MFGKLANAIELNYGLKISSIKKKKSTNPVFFVESDKNIFILKSIVSPEKLPSILQASIELEAIHVDSPRPILTSGRELHFKFMDRYYYLYKHIRGQTISIKQSAEMLETYGNFLARFHLAVKDIKEGLKVSYNFYDMVLAELQELKTNFNDNILIKTEKEISTLSEKFSKLDLQMIHRDYHYGNVLFEGNSITGVLDLDSCIIGCNIYDIAYFLAELLVHNKNTDLIKSQTKFLFGYEKEIKLDEEEKKLIIVMMLIVHIDFAYWFWENNDIEGVNDSLRNLEILYNILSLGGRNETKNI